MKDIFKLPAGECLGVELKKRGVMNLLTDFLHQGWATLKKNKRTHKASFKI